MSPLMILAGLLFLLALGALWWAGRQQSGAGLPAGRVIYADTSQWGRVEKPLYDPQLQLVGKPDYLVDSVDGAARSGPTPVEVKSAWAPESPYPGHLYQLAAYCLLVKKTTGFAPPYGVIRYRNRTFAVDYTPELEAGLLALIAEMRRDEASGELPRSHDSLARCAACGYRGICDQRL